MIFRLSLSSNDANQSVTIAYTCFIFSLLNSSSNIVTRKTQLIDICISFLLLVTYATWRTPKQYTIVCLHIRLSLSLRVLHEYDSTTASFSRWNASSSSQNISPSTSSQTSRWNLLPPVRNHLMFGCHGCSVTDKEMGNEQ